MKRLFARSTALVAAVVAAEILGALAVGAAWAGEAGCDGSGGGIPLTKRSINSGGIERTYLLQVPARHDGSTPLPVILNFHGLGSIAHDKEKDVEVASYAERNGFALIVPQGIGTKTAWNSGGVFSVITHADDVRFARDLLDELSIEFCVNPTRVFSIGKSNGGGMSDRLGCEMPDRIMAIAPVSGAYTERPKKCSKRRKVSVLEFHGDADEMTPYKGGGPIHMFLEIPTWLRDWARRSGCSGMVKKRKIAGNLTKITYRKCPEGIKVEHYRVHDGGHWWFDKPIGGTNVSTTARIIRFLKSRPTSSYDSFAVKVARPGRYVFKALSATADNGGEPKDSFVRRFDKSGAQIVRWPIPKKIRRSKLRDFKLMYRGSGDSGEVHLRIAK